MSKPFLVWLITTFIFVVLDMLWLGIFMSKQYSQKLGFLANMIGGKITFNLPVGLFVQVTIATGLCLFILKIQGANPQILSNILWGAFLGFVIYSTYDLTNYSFVKNWPIDITIIDILWGTLQGAIAGLVVTVASKML